MSGLGGRLLLNAIVLLVAVKCDELRKKEWWETALVYQIWPRGFQDSNGDGEGDLKGIFNRLDYLQNLGIDAICLGPVYPSPLIDSGYDISNYTDIDPVFGNLDDFDELVEEVHYRGLKIILDMVPNHSSDKHKWFTQSCQKIKPYDDYYIWADGRTDNKGNKIPPNNWISSYSDEPGSAWTWHNTRQQWYYHKFHKSQPDLNLRNENVVNELLRVFDFWLRRDVDGFRINGVSYFFEDQKLRDEATVGNGSRTSGLPENAQLVYQFRSYIDNWVKWSSINSILLIAEAHDSDEILLSLYGNKTHKGIPPLNFRFITDIRSTSTAKRVKNVLQNWLDKLPKSNASTNWVLSNHDNSRVASRIGLNRVDGLHMLSLLLPGQAFTYYGDEIAMLDRKMSWYETIDPMGRTRTKETYANYSRDPSRTPMQWNSDRSAGFSTSRTTYLPVHPDYAKINVEKQQNTKKSNLNTYKALAALRKNKVFTHGDYEFASLNNDRVFIFKRFLRSNPVYVIVINLGLRLERVNLTSLYPNLEQLMEVSVPSTNAVNVSKIILSKNIVLTANAALVLKGNEKRPEISSSTKAPNIITPPPHSSSSTIVASILRCIISNAFALLLFRY